MLRSLLTVSCSFALFLVAARAAPMASHLVCESQFNDTGICVPIVDCPLLYSMLLVNTNPKNEDILRRSQCGYDNTQPKNENIILVCCPNKYCKDSLNANSTIQPGNVLPESGKCGTFLSNRLFGGTLTSIREFPWMALLDYKKPNNTYGFHCAGSLINSRYVLTAAHCVRHVELPSSWTLHRVRLGEWNVSTMPDCEVDQSGKKYCAPLHVDVLIESAIVHEQYLPDSFDQFYDIALLRLARPVPYSEFIRPICLPTTPELRKKNFKGSVMDIAGWGSTEKNISSEVKLKIDAEVWDVDRCQAKYRTFSRTINGTHQMCAGGVADIDTCGGDSGGPIMIKERVGDRNVYFAAGVVSYGPRPCGLPDWPGVYTLVGHYIDWIVGHLEP